MSLIKFFSNCSDCKKCCHHYCGTCLAGHGDDDFQSISKKDFDILINRDLESYLKDELIENFPDFIGRK